MLGFQAGSDVAGFVAGVQIGSILRSVSANLRVFPVVVMRCARVREGFARQGLNHVQTGLAEGAAIGYRRRQGGCSAGVLIVRVAVVVVFEIFEDVADVQKSVTVEPDVHESRLHPG
ncbi:MAG: hypothetical protein NVS9B4_22990 [Candidatus Acidiferrum sp.]